MTSGDDALRIAEEVLALDAKATAGAWAVSKVGVSGTCTHDPELKTPYEVGGLTVRLAGTTETICGLSWNGHHDQTIRTRADLISHYRTSAPALARAVLDLDKKLSKVSAALLYAEGEGPMPPLKEHAEAFEIARAREASRTSPGEGEGTGEKR